MTEQTSPASVDERAKLRAQLFDNGLLELTILPTEQCNFRCQYCYETFVGRRMSATTVAAIKALIERRLPTLHTVRIGWFGGEPLLVKDLVLDLSSYASTRCRETAVAFQAGMSTNAYLLTAALAQKLVDCGVSAFQVTLDGDEAYHDTVRVRRDGQPTFARIWGNLEALRATRLSFIVHLRVHLSPQNRASADRLTVRLKESFAGDQRFSVYFKPVMDLGGSRPADLPLLSPPEAAKAIRQLSGTLPPNVTVWSAEDANYICYAARPTAFVIRHDGSVAKCTVGLDDMANRIGRLLPGGILHIDHERFRPWLRGAVHADREVLRCPRAALAPA